MSLLKTTRLALATAWLAATLASGAFAGSTPKTENPVPKAVPIVVHTANGFDWGDAAIGAAAGLGVALAAAGGITLVRNA
ncbi:MAG: hypothetical protein M3R39_08655 [Actinomycetota bacterium]|nr:hypothetical protein [Actinomycetota bacterium]